MLLLLVQHDVIISGRAGITGVLYQHSGGGGAVGSNQGRPIERPPFDVLRYLLLGQLLLLLLLSDLYSGDGSERRKFQRWIVAG